MVNSIGIVGSRNNYYIEKHFIEILIYKYYIEKITFFNNKNETFVLVSFKLMCDMLKVSEELLTEVCNTAQEAVTKTIPQNKKCKKLVWGGFLRSPYKELRKRSERQRIKGNIFSSECRVPKINKEI